VVRPGAERWLLEIHELRLILEPAAAARAAQKMTDEVLNQLIDLGEKVSPNEPEWIKRAREFDYALHLAIADHVSNQPLRDAIYKCWQYKKLSYELAREENNSVLRGYQEHLTILSALKARDPATAATAMELHLRHASSYRPAGTVV